MPLLVAGLTMNNYVGCQSESCLTNCKKIGQNVLGQTIQKNSRHVAIKYFKQKNSKTQATDGSDVILMLVDR